jgi:hypothetical protein
VFTILLAFNIEAKLYCIMTDNASNNGTMVKALARLLEALRITWDPIHNHISCLAHVLNLAVKKFLTTLKIQSRTPEDEWEVLEYKACLKGS